MYIAARQMQPVAIRGGPSWVCVYIAARQMQPVAIRGGPLWVWHAHV